MNTVREYHLDDTIIDIVRDDYNVIPLLSRFSIPLGVGNETIADVCKQENIDAEAFLLMLNFIRSGVIDKSVFRKVSPLSIVDFLKNSHDYFVGYKFPHIRRNLTEALEGGYSDINPAIIRFFDDFTEKARAHFQYEENNLFPYVRKLMDGESSDYSIDTFRTHHDEVTDSLTELKNIILRFYRTSVANRMYDVLVDLYNCEEDLESHNDLENLLLVPMVADRERRMVKK